MAKKYEKYIVTETPTPSIHPRLAGDRQVCQLFINNELDGAWKDAHYLNISLQWRKEDEIRLPFRQHRHDFGEYLVFLGTNQEDPFDLCGEVELWLEDEKYILTKTTVVWCPAGVYHTPVIFHRIDRPIVFFTSSPATHYPPSHEGDERIIDPPPEGYGER